MIDLLAVVAHPDDAELLCGGALLHAADAGYRTAILDLTNGEAGTYGSADLRQAERAAAGTVLGLTARATAGLPDGALVNTVEARVVVASIIRELRPKTVIVHWPDARHPDHRAASEIARDACFLAGVRNFKDAVGEPHRPHKLLYALAYQENAPQPTFVLDVSAQMDRKIEAIFCFDSQFEGKTAMGDVMGGGTRPIREQILAHHAHYGSMIRKPYGEPFWCRESVEVGDLVNLAVGSF